MTFPSVRGMPRGELRRLAACLSVG